eukprot:2490937-Rhodomonas_salina.1
MITREGRPDPEVTVCAEDVASRLERRVGEVEGELEKGMEARAKMAGLSPTRARARARARVCRVK